MSTIVGTHFTVDDCGCSTAQDPEGTGAATGRAAPAEYCVRIEWPSRPVHSRANEGPDEPGPSVDADGRGRGRGERR